MITQKRRLSSRKQWPFIVRLYNAAKALSDSCYNDGGSFPERHFDDKAKSDLDNVLSEFENQTEN